MAYRWRSHFSRQIEPVLRISRSIARYRYSLALTKSPNRTESTNLHLLHHFGRLDQGRCEPGFNVPVHVAMQEPYSGIVCSESKSGLAGWRHRERIPSDRVGGHGRSI